MSDASLDFIYDPNSPPPELLVAASENLDFLEYIGGGRYLTPQETAERDGALRLLGELPNQGCSRLAGAVLHFAREARWQVRKLSAGDDRFIPNLPRYEQKRIRPGRTTTELWEEWHGELVEKLVMEGELNDEDAARLDELERWLGLVEGPANILADS